MQHDSPHHAAHDALAESLKGWTMPDGRPLDKDTLNKLAAGCCECMETPPPAKSRRR